MSNTKNIEGNRKIVVAQYSINHLYKIPDGLDLNDKTVVKNYVVKYGDLHIFYTDGREELISADRLDDEPDKYPVETLIEDADDYDVYYTADEESDDEDEDKEE